MVRTTRASVLLLLTGAALLACSGDDDPRANDGIGVGAGARAGAAGSSNLAVGGRSGQGGAAGKSGGAGLGGLAGAAGAGGDAGNAGTSGSAGNAGDVGNAGNAGAGGSAGNAGSPGGAGNAGSAGASAGAAGTGGASGAGTAGNAGTAGSAGAAGNAGASGSSGGAGASGSSGGAGASGSSGSAGASGSSGSAGASGSSGAAGASGSSGGAGASGSSGGAGASGSSGSAGASGSAGSGGAAGAPTFDGPVPPVCGDGYKHPTEVCDDRNVIDGDGCSPDCTAVEPGWICEHAGVSCRRITCGDGKLDPGEACDDGNMRAFDGCTPQCAFEPSCGTGTGACTSVVGDGILVAPEQCDDGNRVGGDGCSATGQIESGWSCPQVQTTRRHLPFVVRDFKKKDDPGGHPDFEPGVVSLDYYFVEEPLDAEGLPWLDPAGPIPPSVSSATTFAEWYRDGPSNIRLDRTFLTLATQNGQLRVSDQVFFPIDGLGWNDHVNGDKRSFSFTTQTRVWFVYQGGETLFFAGDDDVFAYIAGKKVIDLGGIHGAFTGTATLSGGNAKASNNATVTLGLQVGQLYELRIFHAERAPAGSTYEVELRNFSLPRSSCSQ